MRSERVAAAIVEIPLSASSSEDSKLTRAVIKRLAHWDGVVDPLLHIDLQSLQPWRNLT